VLWCVFYFISLSYNPPSNGTCLPFLSPPPSKGGARWFLGWVGGWGGAVRMAATERRCKGNVECEIKKTWQ